MDIGVRQTMTFYNIKVIMDSWVSQLISFDHAFLIWKVSLLIVLILGREGWRDSKAHICPTQSIQDMEASILAKIILSLLVIVLRILSLMFCVCLFVGIQSLSTEP